MTRRQAWLRFERRGGSPPADDEELALAEDGSFTARRTIGGRRIGRFEGRLAAAPLTRIRAAAEAVASAEDRTIATPAHGATEVLEVGGHTLQVGSNESPPKPWRALLDRVRSLLVNDIVESPLSAVELIADAQGARLAHRGTKSLDVDLGSVVVRVVHLAKAGDVLDRWEGRATKGLVDNGERLVPTPAWATAAPGWSAALPFDHGFELARGATLQVWVDLPVRDGGRVRAGQLYMPVLHD